MQPLRLQKLKEWSIQIRIFTHIQETDMEYFKSLINRKFKDVVGTRYKDVLKDYREFLLTEDEIVICNFRKILMPLDIFVKEVSEDLYDLLTAFDGIEINLVYITDSDVVSIISDVLGEDTAEVYQNKKEDYGTKLLEKISRELEGRGMVVNRRQYSGHKWDDVEIMSENYDLVAISKCYGGGRGDENEISPVAQRLVQQMSVSTVLY